MLEINNSNKTNIYGVFGARSWRRMTGPGALFPPQAAVCWSENGLRLHLLLEGRSKTAAHGGDTVPEMQWLLVKVGSFSAHSSDRITHLPNSVRASCYREKRRLLAEHKVPVNRLFPHTHCSPAHCSSLHPAAGGGGGGLTPILGPKSLSPQTPAWWVLSKASHDPSPP